MLTEQELLEASSEKFAAALDLVDLETLIRWTKNKKLIEKTKRIVKEEPEVAKVVGEWREACCTKGIKKVSRGKIWFSVLYKYVQELRPGLLEGIPKNVEPKEDDFVVFEGRDPYLIRKINGSYEIIAEW